MMTMMIITLTEILAIATVIFCIYLYLANLLSALCIQMGCEGTS